MSSFGAAPAASARVPVPVTARTPLFEGAIVKVKVPLEATQGFYPDGDNQVPFFQFHRSIRGGRVNFFVHTNDEAVLGKTIRAETSVIKKTLADDREYLYVDLKPVPRETPVTHRISVMNAGSGSWNDDDHMVIETPAPLAGVVIFGPPEGKVVQGATVVQLVIPAKQAPPAEEPAAVAEPQAEPAKPTSTGDSQLDRLIAAGWAISSEEGRRVVLTKVKNGEPKSMVHHRPKPRRSQQSRKR